jgi:hypothetical protein
MTTYNQLKKIIPPDQALANQALSRSLRQVKEIFNTQLPDVAQAVSNLETNKDLNLINTLETPLPPQVADFWGNTFATGSGPGNTVTINDVIGVAAGATINTVLPESTEIIQQLASIGALNQLTANGGSNTSSINGVYTTMQYTLAGDYTTIIEISPGNIGPPPEPPVYEFTITIPSPLPGAGTYGPDFSYTPVIDAAFSNLISIGTNVIANIATTYSEQANILNQDSTAMAQQLAFNVTNATLAGIDIANVVNDIANADLTANSVSTSLSIASRLHDIGLDITEGGAAQFFDSVANTATLSGQAVVASMREGRNIAVLNAIGIQLDTQLPDFNPNETVANNISNAQYSVSEAQANIVI